MNLENEFVAAGRQGFRCGACFAVALAATVAFAQAEPVVSGRARFTVLTPELIRMEYDPAGHFEDRRTTMIVNRDVPDVPCTVVREGAGVTIDTGRVKLVYRGGEFATNTLAATFPFGSWHYGQEDRGNLMGTTRTLDQISGWKTLKAKLEKGILSRDGWAVVDDTASCVFVPSPTDWGEWIARRGGTETHDLYLFAYGHDYRRALGDYVTFAGRIPLPPRWAFGYWWSRYWAYSDAEIRALVEKMERLGVPMDVFVIDMDWHETWGLGTGAMRWTPGGEAIGWGGYTWNRRLFPNPEKLLKDLRAKGLKVALNLHPAAGVDPRETCYTNFCRAIGFTPSPTNEVPYRLEDPLWARAYFETVLDPIQAQGVDFWWLDWQQWLESKSVKGLSSTFWLNHVFNRHSGERGERPFIYHRWGGLGSHRYQIGFSGDSIIGWEMLETIPYFTSVSGNVGYGYWGHDIGGHCGGNGRDGELYLRWLQSGVFNPIFKTHSTKSAEIERRPWMYPDLLDDLLAAFRLRYRLAPYIYTAAREAYDTGLSPCRPLYWYWPEEDAAYDEKNGVFLFGDDILSLTLAQPGDPKTGLTTREFWIPPGTWYDVSSGSLVTGGVKRTFSCTLHENPWLARAGAILPMSPPEIRNLAADDASHLELLFVPGGTGGRTRLYEDDGVSADYAEKGAWTEVAWRDEGSALEVRIGAREGDAASLAAARRWTLRLPVRACPESVRENGRDLAWRYDGDLALVIDLPRASVAEPRTVRIAFAAEDAARASRLYGWKGFLARCRHQAEPFKMNACDMWGEWEKTHWTIPKGYANPPDAFERLAGFATRLGENPSSLAALLDEAERDRAALAEMWPTFEKSFKGDFAGRFKAQVLDYAR